MIAIDVLPFFFKALTDSNNDGKPHFLKFLLYYDEDLKMFRQKSTNELNSELLEIYKNGSLVEGSVSSESGKIYINQIISYLFENFNLKKDSSVLEIGFGSGVLLKELKLQGLEKLAGIEPGNHKVVEGLGGINLIRDFFPTALFKDKVDLIYSFGILEHLEDPLSFLTSQINQINENGRIIFSVPNCEPYLNEGDLSIFIHEHFSYFTRDSIINLVKKTGFKTLDISVIEGALIATIGKQGKELETNNSLISKDVYFTKANNLSNRISNLFQNYSESEIAIYAPMRAMNLLFISNKLNVRLIDDSTELHGKYLPSLSSKIESFEELLVNPPKCLLIFSRTFGERIKQKCIMNIQLKNTEIILLSDFETI